MEKWNIHARDSLTVGLVDDDWACKQAIEAVILSAGFAVASFSNAEHCLKSSLLHSFACIVVDYKMPTMDGVQFIQESRAQGFVSPIIAISGYGTIPLAVDFMRMGAVTFLEKPLDFEKLTQSIEDAVLVAAIKETPLGCDLALQELLSRLTTRENQVLGLGLSGLGIKQIAAKLSIQRSTVEVHRSNILRKVGFKTMQELMMELMTKCPETTKRIIGEL